MINAQTLTQAREALATFSQYNLALLAEVRGQASKIAELERELAKQANIASEARQALGRARIENDALRSQIPNEATQEAFDQLVNLLSEPSSGMPDFQAAA